jgi:hypothetical protein
MNELPRESLRANGDAEMPGVYRLSSGAAISVGIVLIVIFVVGLLLFMEKSTYETWGGLFVAPVLILVTLPILSRQAKREGDRSLFWLLIAALLVKLGGALIFHFVAYDLYGGTADAATYHEGGLKLAQQFRTGDYDANLDPLIGVNFIKLVAGILYTIIGPTKFGGYLFFSWLGFLGLFLFYRAFTIAVPEGRGRTYARFVFFLPSLAFWPSSIGKEAWMMLALGVAAFGAARLFSGKTLRGVLIAGLGMWMATLVRPHMAALVAVALAVGYVLRRPREELRQLAPIAKGLSIAVLVVIAAVVIVRAERFLNESGVETEQGVAGVQSSITVRSGGGGSQFVPSILRSPTQAPNALLTVMFRPLPHEAHNFQALAASLENSFLLIYTLVRIPWGFAALKSMRRQPYVAMALAYTAMFIIAFSSFSNFGNLVRQRVQVLPFFVALLCIPPRRSKQMPPSLESSEWGRPPDRFDPAEVPKNRETSGRS